MNENPFASPVETPETLEKEVRPWGELLPQMAWAKWGMVWIAGCMAGYWVWSVYYFGDIWILEALFGLHAVGMFFCCLGLKSVIKRRWRTLGWASVLLFGMFFLGVTFFRPEWSYRWGWGDWPWRALGAGIWIWLVFLVKLAHGVRSRLCQGLAWVVFLCDTFVASVILSEIIDFHNFHNYDVRTLAETIMWLSMGLYPLLTVCFWWRIRRMLRTGRER